MTNSETIKILNTVLFFGKCELPNEYAKECLKTAIQALEKQIPNKSIDDEYCGFTSYICPVCRHEVEVSDYYCRHCGQKIRKTTNN